MRTEITEGLARLESAMRLQSRVIDCVISFGDLVMANNQEVLARLDALKAKVVADQTNDQAATDQALAEKQKEIDDLKAKVEAGSVDPAILDRIAEIEAAITPVKTTTDPQIPGGETPVPTNPS